ncbi:neuronal acetylcholine receptor subunit alpha-6 [Nilaparvata lugens]|uniref:neuronal acetylcholine receptor subunit alpha-6 n=1 Tax=Nilaparvata lugens TaxID=108931 RepID=UPI00193CED91|nr:neuronal acetylcholine receptor subunit alpha-6 [Nilaparvata lugens]
MNGMVFYSTALIILMKYLSGVVEGNSNCETELLPRLVLRCNLLENYLERPVQTTSTKVHVNTTIFPIDMDFQDHMQSLEVTLWMNMTWKDENLVWNPKDAGISSIFIECDEIWTPVLTSLDRRKIDENYEGVFCELSYDGVVKRTVTKTFVNTCYNGLDFSLWPFDEHQCSIFIGVPQTSDLDIYFKVEEFEMHAFGRDTAWVVEVVKPPPIIHPVKRFELEFKFKRPRLVQGSVIIFTTMG